MASIAMGTTQKRKSLDLWLFALTLGLLAIGVALVFDASYARAGQVKYTNEDSLFFLKRQALFAAVGVVIMLIAAQVPYWKLKKYAFPSLIVGIIGLCAVFVHGIGMEVNGAKRWIEVRGVPIQIQPSEFTKLALVLFLAVTLSSAQKQIRDWKYGLLPALVPIAIIGLLIMAEPDMGTTIVMAMTGFVMIYVAGARKSHMATVFCGAFVLGLLLIVTEPYRLARVTAFVNPFAEYDGTGYQVCRSLIALGSGGIFGVGVCEGREKLFYLPAEHTDFIFATLGEEMGLIGALVLTALFLFFGLRGFAIASRTRERFAKLMAAGLSTLICGQALLNIAVVTSSVPATGVPLPFISYGGSSLALNLLGVGILLGISQYPGYEKDYHDEDSANRRRYRRSRVSRAEYR